MDWYEDEVKHLEKNSLKLNYAPETLFYGSSSIRMWDTLYRDMAQLKPVNLGFGGSTLAACVWFFDRIMMPFEPKRLIVYAGDNDLGDGRSPEEVFISFQELVAKANARFGQMPCYFISLKPSIARWHMADKFKYANSLIETEIIKQNNNWHFINIFPWMLNANGSPNAEYYGQDGLHMNAKGYEVWTQIIGSAVTV
jgi:lysophospholipase L1-like esterase